MITHEMSTAANYARQVARQCIAILAMLLFLATMGVTADAAQSTKHVNVDAKGYVINQYDPVTYFTEGKPVRGKLSITVEYKGAKYAFASVGNRDLFRADPERYLPQYGGYCAYGIVHGGKSKVDPEVWDIVDGKLYLMISGGTMSVWKKKKQAYIEIADKAWQTIILR